MLFTGNNNHVAGVARQAMEPGPVIPGLAGYEARLATGRVAVWIRARGPVLRLLSRDELIELVDDMGLDPAGFGPEDAA